MASASGSCVCSSTIDLAYTARAVHLWLAEPHVEPCTVNIFAALSSAEATLVKTFRSLRPH